MRNVVVSSGPLFLNALVGTTSYDIQYPSKLVAAKVAVDFIVRTALLRVEKHLSATKTIYWLTTLILSS